MKPVTQRLSPASSHSRGHAFDDESRSQVCARDVEAIEPWREDQGYRPPGELVIVAAVAPGERRRIGDAAVTAPTAPHNAETSARPDGIDESVSPLLYRQPCREYLSSSHSMGAEARSLFFQAPAALAGKPFPTSTQIANGVSCSRRPRPPTQWQFMHAPRRQSRR